MMFTCCLLTMANKSRLQSLELSPRRQREVAFHKLGGHWQARFMIGRSSERAYIKSMKPSSSLEHAVAVRKVF